MIIYGAGHEQRQHPQPSQAAGRSSPAAGPARSGANRHFSYDDDPPVANLFMSLLGKLGVQPESFGDSTGELQELSDV